MISLDEMTALARALLDAEQATADAETNLKLKKERERIIREETIPSAMQELGLTSIKLETGQTLSVKQEVYASIPSGNKQAAYDWLIGHGFGGLLKVEVVADFGRGELEIATELFERLNSEGLSVGIDQGVHAQTLKAFLKEQISAGKDIPLELFGARPIFQAKISKK